MKPGDRLKNNITGEVGTASLVYGEKVTVKLDNGDVVDWATDAITILSLADKLWQLIINFWDKIKGNE